MDRLIDSMLTSLDGFAEDEYGQFGWGDPEDEAVHTFINERGAHSAIRRPRRFMAGVQ